MAEQTPQERLEEIAKRLSSEMAEAYGVDSSTLDGPPDPASMAGTLNRAIREAAEVFAEIAIGLPLYAQNEHGNTFMLTRGDVKEYIRDAILSSVKDLK